MAAAMQIAGQIELQLSAVIAPDSPNRFDAPEIQALALEYLESYDEELRDFPDLAGESHWNLWMADERAEDAVFVLMVFHPGRVEFLCGTGDASAIRNFAEHRLPESMYLLANEFRQRFAAPADALQLSREQVESWLGRSW
jgi:hypothetical protein